MNYHFSKIVKVPFEQAITSVVEGLKREGFGILTDIDVKAILKNKLGADFRPGARPKRTNCKPRMRISREGRRPYPTGQWRPAHLSQYCYDRGSSHRQKRRRTQAVSV
jgi:hypothetical protein